MHKKHKKRLEGDHQTITFGVVGVDAAQRHKRPYQLGFLDLGAPYFDFLKGLGVVLYVWSGVMLGGGVLVKVCIFYNQKMHVYIINWFH